MSYGEKYFWLRSYYWELVYDQLALNRPERIRPATPWGGETITIGGGELETALDQVWAQLGLDTDESRDTLELPENLLEAL